MGSGGGEVKARQEGKKARGQEGKRVRGAVGVWLTKTGFTYQLKL